MTMLKTLTGHEKVDVRIEGYLRDKNGKSADRALAWDFISFPWLRGDQGWSKDMERTRRTFDRERGTGSLRPVYYRHYIISPDPRDNCDLDTLREIAVEWAKRNFGDEETMTNGACGMAEVAICYHDDNVNGILHAHVVVNNIDLRTCKKLHFDNKAVRHTLPDSLQEISREHGLSYFENGDHIASKAAGRRGAYLTKVERAFLQDGRFSWKADLRDRIQVAFRVSRDEEEFVRRMRDLGVIVTESSKGDGDWLYAHESNPNRWKVTGYRLGGNYTRKSVAMRLHATLASLGDSPGHQENFDARADNVMDALRSVPPLSVDEQGHPDKVSVAAYVSAEVSVAKVARCLRVADKHGIACEQDFEEAIAALGTRIEAESDEVIRTRLEARMDELVEASELSRRGDLLLGTRPLKGPDRMEEIRARAKRAEREARAAEAADSSGDNPRRAPGRTETQGRRRLMP